MESGFNTENSDEFKRGMHRVFQVIEYLSNPLPEPKQQRDYDLDPLAPGETEEE